MHISYIAIGDRMHSLDLIYYWFIYHPWLLFVYHNYFAAQLCNQWDPNLWSLLHAIRYWMYIQVVHVSYSLKGVIFTHAKKSDFLGVNVTPKVGVHIVASVSLQIWSELYSTVLQCYLSVLRFKRHCKQFCPVSSSKLQHVHLWPYLTKPAHGIHAQCAFLVLQVKKCQGRVFVIFI